MFEHVDVPAPSFPVASYRALGERLRGAGLAETLRWLETIAPAVPALLARPVRAYHLRQREDDAARLALLFSMGEPLPLDESQRLLGESLVHELLDVGTLTFAGPRDLASEMRVVLSGGELVVVDDPLKPDALVVDPFTAVLLRHAGAEVLDLRSGAGLFAIAARGSKVVAFDPSPRARELTEANVAFAARDGVVVREPSERFELVVATSAGLRRDLLRLVREVAPRVGRRGLIVGHFAESELARLPERVPPELDARVIHQPGPDLDTLAILEAATRTRDLGAKMAREAIRRRAQLDELGPVRTALVSLQPGSGGLATREGSIDEDLDR